jgi:hypothetical protein
MRSSDPAQARRKQGAMLIIGLFLSSVLDPRTKPAVEQLDRIKSTRRTDPGRENE